MHRLTPLLHLVTHPSAAHAILLVGLVLVVAAAAYMICRLSVATVLSIGVGLEIFSGNWRYMHIPLPLDRIALAFGVAMLVLRGSTRTTGRRLVFSPIHLLMIAIVGYVGINSAVAGTLGTSTGFYTLLDKLGVIPFIMFALAPLVFRTAKARNTLLVVLVCTGLYLGITAVGEGLHIHAIVFPRYILNPNIGIHYGRARGPFLESVADGLCMFICGVAAAVALTEWRSRLARLACYATMVLSVAGGLFTVTRTVWVGIAVSTVVAMLWVPKLRRWVPPLLVVGTAVVLGLIKYVPGLSTKASSRADEVSPLWDRYNTNDAALRAWVHSPIFGIGWDTFPTKGVDWLRQAATYPMTGAGLEVHNVLLSQLVELGVVGALLWATALFSTLGGAVLRKGPSDLYAWRIGLVAIFTFYLIASNLGPMSYPFPNLMLWMWAGIVMADRYSVEWAPLQADVRTDMPELAGLQLIGR